jgi:hypothetical protein
MKKKTTTSTLLLRYLWSQMQEGRRHFEIADTNLAFSATAQQLSKAVRRFNESGHQLRFSGWRFHARVVDVYTLTIDAEQIIDPKPDSLI